jgi:hypothetical protein
MPDTSAQRPRGSISINLGALGNGHAVIHEATQNARKRSVQCGIGDRRQTLSGQDRVAEVRNTPWRGA